MDHFPLIRHQRAGGGIDCPGIVVVQGSEHRATAILGCDECGAEVGTINHAILRDLVNLATDLDTLQLTPEDMNRLPWPLRDYIHDLEARADPAGEVQELALARMTITAQERRCRELEARWARLEASRDSISRLLKAEISLTIRRLTLSLENADKYGGDEWVALNANGTYSVNFSGKSWGSRHIRCYACTWGPGRWSYSRLRSFCWLSRLLTHPLSARNALFRAFCDNDLEGIGADPNR